MTRRPVRRLLVALLMLAAPWVAAWPEVLEPGQAHAASGGVVAENLAAEIEQAAAQGSSARLVALAADIERRGDLHPVARERLLAELAVAFSRVEPDPTARALTDRLALRPASVRIWLREGGHRTAVIAFDVAAAARYAARRWAERSAALEAGLTMASSPDALLARYAGGGAAFERGAIEAIQSASPESLLMLRDAVARALPDDPRIAALAVPLALRLGDTALLALSAAHGDTAVVLRALDAIAATLLPADALVVLESALPRPELGSAALFQIGRLADSEPAARARLLTALDDPDLGGTAAAALARLDDPAIALELGRRLSSGGSGLPERRALLALRLSRGEAARAAIDDFLRSPAASPILKRDAELWLAE
jgi:hypothetical protein